MKDGRVWSKLIIGVTVTFLYLPLAVVALISFSDRQTPGFPIGNLTMAWYREIIADGRIVETTIRSLSVAALATLIGLILGALAALSLSRRRGPFVGFLNGLYVAPNIVPALVLGVAMAMTFSFWGVRLSFGTIVIGHSMLTSSLVYLLVAARLRGFDWSIVEAARVLGATPSGALRKVIFPLVVPAVAGGGLLGFVVSLDNFILSFFLSGGDSTLPMLMWSMMREGITPLINAIATLMLVATVVLALLAERLSGRGARLTRASNGSRDPTGSPISERA